MNNFTNWILIKLILVAYPFYFAIVVILGIFAMLNLVGQPFINDAIKNIIGEKFGNHGSLVIIQVIAIFLSSKIISGILNIVADYYGMIYGVKIYNAVALALIKSIKNKSIDSKFIACIEDDCQRLQYLPYSFINASSKILQGIILSSMLISKLPNNAFSVSMLYWLFFVISLILSFYSSRLNLKIMESKEKRIQFGSKQLGQILMERRNQLKEIRKLMMVDGVGIILPWFINVGLMAVVYGVVGLDHEEKYFVLLILGLLRVSISGLGTNLSIFGQAWSSLSRISSYINDKYIQPKSTQKLLQQQPHIINLNLNKTPNSPPKPTKLEQKNFPISQLLQKTKQLTPSLFPFLIFFSLLNFAGNFMYGYCAKSLLMNQSIFSTFNVITLGLQLLAPMLLYTFICVCNLRVSRDIYRRLLKISSSNVNTCNSNSNIQALLTQKHQKIQNFTPEQINRLSGDIRLLDRQLYTSGYGFISRIMGIFASFIYSVISLNNILLIVLIVVLIVIALWFGWFCRKFMTIRKQCYRKSAIQKGNLLKTFYKNKKYKTPWQQIYTYKVFGYIVEIVYITILQFLLVILATIVVICIMLSAANIQTTSVVVLLISQLDSQFMLLFVQVIYLETVTAAVCRCYSMLKNRMCGKDSVCGN